MEKKYYTQFLWTWIVISVMTWVMVLLIEIIQHQRLPEWNDLGIIAAYSVGITAGLLAVAIPLFPVIIRPTGLSTYNFWGIYSAVVWEDIHDVRAVNILGLRYCTFRSKTGGKLYLPKFLRNFIGLRDQVAEWAGEQHPLTQALSTM